MNAAVSQPSIAFNKLSSRNDPFDADNLIRTYGNNLTIQYDFTPNFSVKSITAYRQLQVQIQENTSGGDFEEYNDTANFFKSSPIFGNNPTNLLPAGGTSFFCASCSVTRTWQHQFSEELQGIGKIGQVIDYVAGLYYFDEGGGTVNAFEANAAPLANYGVAIAGVAPEGLPPLTSATTTLPASAFLNGEAAEILSQSAAAYLHVTGHVTSKLDLSAGVRYTDDYKSQTVSSAIYTTLIDPATITAANPAGTLVPQFRSVNFGRVTYDGTATYHFTPDINAYVRYATAYLAGGLFRNIEFKPEDTKAEEVGIKSQLFEHRLQIDGALFHQEDSNYQDNNINPQGALYVANVGSLTTQGGELQVTYVPIRGVTLSGNGGYADQRYSDNRPPAAPRTTLAFNAQYDLPRFSNDMYVSMEADTNYSSKYHSIPYALSSGPNSTFALPPAAYQAFGFQTQAAYLDYLDKQAYDGGYWITNARVSLLDIPVNGLKGRLSAFVTNVFDERGPLYTQNYGLFIGTNFQPDRAYGIDLAVAF